MATKPLTQTTGRRKEAVARARLRPGTGTIKINGRAFGRSARLPLERASCSSQFCQTPCA